MFRYLYGADIGVSLLDTTELETAIPTKQFAYLLVFVGEKERYPLRAYL